MSIKSRRGSLESCLALFRHWIYRDRGRFTSSRLESLWTTKALGFSLDPYSYFSSCGLGTPLCNSFLLSCLVSFRFLGFRYMIFSFFSWTRPARINLERCNERLEALSLSLINSYPLKMAMSTRIAKLCQTSYIKRVDYPSHRAQ